MDIKDIALIATGTALGVLGGITAYSAVKFKYHGQSDPRAGMIKMILSGRRFRKMVDLGCGSGMMATTLAQYADSLVGVDHNQERLEQAARTGAYTRLILSDMRDTSAWLDPDVDIVVMLDSLEHIPKQDGMALIRTLLGRGISLVITTPEYTSPLESMLPVVENRHVSTWTQEELRSLGMEAVVVPTTTNLFEIFMWGGKVVAWKIFPGWKTNTLRLYMLR